MLKDLPSMTNADDMIHITHNELQQLIRQYTGSIREAKQRVICEDSPKTHRSSMQDSLMAQTAETGMTVHYLDLLSNHYIAEDRKEREDCRKGGLSIDDQKGHMVDFKAICQVSNTCSSFVCVCDDNDFVATINQFLCLSVWLT
jgi:hypothetical protein